MRVIPTINSGSDNYTATINDIYGLVEKVAKQSFFGVESDNPLSHFYKGDVDKGTTIEQWMIQLCESYAFDKNAVDVFKGADPDYVVRYFKDWTERQYEATVRDDEIRKILKGESSVEDVSAKIIANLTESDENENFENLKGVLAYIKTQIDASDSATNAGVAQDGAEFLKLIKNAVDKMKFMNSTFSVAGAKYRCPLDRIRIVMPYGVKNAVDVDTLASLFHVEKAEILEKIDVIDTEDGIVYIVDESAVLWYRRLSEIEPTRNAKARKTIYYKTVDDLFAYSPIFKATYIDASAID